MDIGFGDLLAWGQWVIANLWLVAIGAVALVTAQFWLPTLIRFFTETKLGAALAAIALAFGAGAIWIKKDRREHEAIGEARAERRLRERAVTPKTKPGPNEWWRKK